MWNRRCKQMNSHWIHRRKLRLNMICICMGNQQNLQWSICADGWRYLLALRGAFRRSLKASMEGESTSEASRAFHSLMVRGKKEFLYASMLAGMTQNFCWWLALVLESAQMRMPVVGMATSWLTAWNTRMSLGVWCLSSSESHLRSLSICLTLLNVE